ncbi:MAG: flagellar basal-body MS-ring/collar protein FliF [Thermoleophilaceae bacterium]
MASLKTLLQNMTPKGRAVLGGSIVAVVMLAFLMMQMASAPSYSTMLTGLDPAQTGKLTAALDGKGIQYEIQNNGTALAVDKAQVAQARIALASKGLPETAQPGMALMDKQGLGSSDFQQQVTYQRALEGQLAQTIGQVDGVQGASVQLVMPQDALFQDQQSKAKAAVLLSGGTGNLQPGAVRGIAQLVASSVKGLGLQDVTITDGTGQLLWPNQASGASDGQMAATTKQAAEARYAQGLQSNLNALLVRTVGPGKAQVQVNADLNTDQVTRDQLAYAPKGVPLHQVTEAETLRGGGGQGGAAGAASNTIPSYAAAGGANSNYNRRSSTTDWGVPKTVTHTTVAPGAVNHQSVAVLVDKSVPAAEVASIRSAVQNAAGITPARGDTLAVSQISFARPAKPKSGALAPAGLISMAKYVGAAIAMLAFLFFVTRHLRRREDQALLGEPVWLREIQAPTTLAELELGGDGYGELTRSRQQNVARGELESIMSHEPERVAQQVRAWINEE